LKKLYVYAGVAASAVMILVGVGLIVISAIGHSEVRDRLADEQIVGTPDMNPTDTKAAVEEAGVDVDIPDCDVAEKPVDTGKEAFCFGDYMRVHALEDTGGKTYSEMPRFLDKNGEPTADAAQAAIDPKTGAPVSNPARDIWISETAFSSALYTSFFAEKVAEYAFIMGICLLLIGIGFLVLTLRLPSREERVA
jgi:hypothetical protein